MLRRSCLAPLQDRYASASVRSPPTLTLTMAWSSPAYGAYCGRGLSSAQAIEAGVPLGRHISSAGAKQVHSSRLKLHRKLVYFPTLRIQEALEYSMSAVDHT